MSGMGGAGSGIGSAGERRQDGQDRGGLRQDGRDQQRGGRRQCSNRLSRIGGAGSGIIGARERLLGGQTRLRWGAGQDLGLRGPAAVRKMRHRSRVLYLCPIRVAPG